MFRPRRPSSAAYKTAGNSFVRSRQKAYMAKISCNQLVIDTATYLLTISPSTFKEHSSEPLNIIGYDVVEPHCYVIDIG